MKVKLIQSTQNLLDTIYTSARTCYNAGSPIDMWFDVCTIPTDKKIKLVEHCIKSRHLSVLEHSQFTFAIEGISRACSHQLVRHRHCSFSQQSQRYVEIKEDIDKLHSVFGSPNEKEIIDKYFVINPTKKENTSDYYTFCNGALINYLELVKDGEKPEDARMVLPNCTKTNLVLTCNLRELMHLCNERLCSKAQKEIRQLVQRMASEVIQDRTKDNKWLIPYLVPKCEMLGHCPEDKSCGRKAK